MISPASILAKIRRWTASLMCLCWLAGFVYCQTMCLTGMDFFRADKIDSLKVSASCHSTNQTQSPPCHSNSKSSDSEDFLSCCCALDVVHQSFHDDDLLDLNDILVSSITSLKGESDSSHPQLVLAYLRNQLWREWSLTPELYLGPGIHSQAPPSVS